MILKKIIHALHPVNPDNLVPLNNPVPSNKKLVLFFAGWGMDEQLFSGYARSEQNLMIAYDYSSLTLDETLLKGYDEIQVFAWSMGVWAASQVLPKLQTQHYPIGTCTAINGTPYPIDDNRGIPVQIFKATLNTLNEKTLDKFRLRMCGSRETLNHFLARAPRRDIASLRKELAAIEEQATVQSGTTFQWDQAYIGKDDRIFSSENQQRAWAHSPHTFVDTPHYPKQLFKQLLQEI
ncbi:DUF452 family protein [Sphingobacterium sp. CZ-UAM]|uniref:DUF452 family protein n=1 Tax=Sphingobacterium sp. CZ-UAM TaxID=1933868 RepID=UPI000987056D|nr:pimeloyl-ACP methyl esterase BioG family protein [Sphingobacterium sp. CZ-UAM]